jgi:hypothetical protein
LVEEMVQIVNLRLIVRLVVVEAAVVVLQLRRLLVQVLQDKVLAAVPSLARQQMEAEAVVVQGAQVDLQARTTKTMAATVGSASVLLLRELLLVEAAVAEEERHLEIQALALAQMAGEMALIGITY